METLAVALRVALSLAVVLGLLWVLHRRLSRGTRVKGRSETLAVVGRQNVGPKASVVVVDVDGRRFLLGVTEQSVNVLHSGEVPAEQISERTFARSMSEALGPRAAPGLAAVTPFAEAQSEITAVTMLRPRRHAASNSKLAGSILSPATWTQAATALRQAK
ncbi:MAG: hypothetical protein JWL94_910 [Microbacteriaceae bacterium]|nr:hypothetical protein [Microbacteriaceae bacterium]HEV7956132.1 flagellar biosynthetic protein FliO [Marisediminicola sp.]